MMKKLTAGIFAGILTVVAVGAANAEIASKEYADTKVRINQGTSEGGKVMAVNSSGYIVPTGIQGSQGISITPDPLTGNIVINSTITDTDTTYTAGDAININSMNEISVLADNDNFSLDIDNQLVLNMATDSTLGGVKAAPKESTDTQPVRIDTSTGRLYTAAASAGTTTTVGVATNSQLGIQGNPTSGYTLNHDMTQFGDGTYVLVARVVNGTTSYMWEHITGRDDSTSYGTVSSTAPSTFNPDSTDMAGLTGVQGTLPGSTFEP